MRVYRVCGYTPYEGEEHIAIFNRPPTKEELAGFKKLYDHKEEIYVDEEDVIE